MEIVTGFRNKPTMNTGERLGDDGSASKMTGFKRGVFARRTLSVVLVSDSNPVDVVGLVRTRYLGNRSEVARDLMSDLNNLL